MWSRDGRELLFQTLERVVMAVNYTAKGETFTAETCLGVLGAASNHDIAPDGKRLAAMKGTLRSRRRI